MRRNLLTVPLEGLDGKSITASLSVLRTSDRWPESWPPFAAAVVQAERSVSAFVNLYTHYMNNPNTPNQSKAVAKFKDIPLEQIQAVFMDVDDRRVLELNKARNFMGMSSTFVLFEAKEVA